MLNHLLRIPAVFEPLVPEILGTLGQGKVKKLGGEYHLVKNVSIEQLTTSPVAPFIPWRLPLGHSWPCHPVEMDGFIEKAAQALLVKFADPLPQAVLVGSLAGNSENSYYKSLASNLRGRILQIFPKLAVSKPEEQAATAPTLFCMVGREGLYAGVCSPQQAGGFYPGGTKFMKQSGPDAISRAGAKIAEALHHLQLHDALPPKRSHWLELGASPGGMTSELLARDYLVTAVDRAPLDRRLMSHPNLRFIQNNAADFEFQHGDAFDGLLCDMNGEANFAFTQVLRLLPALRSRALMVFTLKTPTAESFADLLRQNAEIAKRAALHHVEMISHTHLTYNRKEFTLLLRKA